MSSEEEWLFSGQMRFGSLREIIEAYPGRFASNFAHNLVKSIRLIIESTSMLAVFVVPAAIEWVLGVKRANRAALAVVGSVLLFYLLLVSQAFVFAEVFLSWVIIAVALTAGLLLRYADLARERWPVVRRLRVPEVALVLLVVLALRYTTTNVRGYLHTALVDTGEMADAQEVAEALRRYDPAISTKYVMAFHPGYALYAGSRYLELPGYYEGSVDGLPTYRGLSGPVRTYVPRFPSLTPDDSLSADYLVYDLAARRYLPHFAFLSDTASGRIPASFTPVYRSNEGVTVYAIAHR